MSLSASLRTFCPPGACTCGRERLLDTEADARLLLLNRAEEQRLLARLARLESLADLAFIQQRLREQLGIELQVMPGSGEVRSVKGLLIRLEDRPGLCRKLHKSIPATIRQALTQRPEIVFELLNAHDLLRDA